MTELEKAARMALEQIEFLNACYPHKTAADTITALAQALATTEPIPMVLHCPKCGMQHIDESEDERTEQICHGPEVVDAVIVGWDNPPHRSHLCHGCGTIWRPADVPTTGVASVRTKGKADTWEPSKEQVAFQDRRRNQFMAGYAAAEADAAVCQVPPPGWHCTRKAGHEGPCAAVPTDDAELVTRAMERLRQGEGNDQG